jgi:hypothetical protein
LKRVARGQWLEVSGSKVQILTDRVPHSRPSFDLEWEFSFELLGPSLAQRDGR